MLDLQKKGDDELIKLLSADIENLEFSKKEVGQAISDFNDAFLKIESQLALKKQQRRRLKTLGKKK